MKALISCLTVLGLLPLGVLADEFDAWVHHSPLIFLATIVTPNASTQPDLPSSAKTVIVKVDRVFRTKPILGKLVGKKVTVLKTTPWSSTTGQQFLFFTNSLIYGDSLALREVGHYDATAFRPDEIDRRISSAIGWEQDRKLKARLDGAELVVVGKVSAVNPVPEPEARFPKTPEQRAPKWWQARVKVESVEKGRLDGDTVSVLFPTARSWTGFPKFSRNHEGIWILRREQLKLMPAGGYLTAFDPSDFSDKAQLERIRELLRAK